MPLSDARRRANSKWDKENMTMLNCKIRKDYALQFKEKVAQKRTTVNAVLKDAVDTFMREDTESGIHSVTVPCAYGKTGQVAQDESFDPAAYITPIQDVGDAELPRAQPSIDEGRTPPGVQLIKVPDGMKVFSCKVAKSISDQAWESAVRKGIDIEATLQSIVEQIAADTEPARAALTVVPVGFRPLDVAHAARKNGQTVNEWLCEAIRDKL